MNMETPLIDIREQNAIYLHSVATFCQAQAPDQFTTYAGIQSNMLMNSSKNNCNENYIDYIERLMCYSSCCC